MTSTGEVMGVAPTFGAAFAKGLEGGSQCLPRSGKALISVRELDRQRAIQVAKDLKELGFEIAATRGTAREIKAAGIECEIVNKVAEGRPHVVDMIKNNEFSIIMNTTEGKQAILDSRSIRASASQHKVSYFTTINGAEAAVMALRHPDEVTVNSLRSLQS
jgi:carbamoyl-phosphate synthase large subunit